MTYRINKSLLFLLRPPIIILVVIVVFVASSSYMHAAILMFTLGHVLFSSGSALSVQELHIIFDTVQFLTRHAPLKHHITK